MDIICPSPTGAFAECCGDTGKGRRLVSGAASNNITSNFTVDAHQPGSDLGLHVALRSTASPSCGETTLAIARLS
jgi:hypothetical protein